MSVENRHEAIVVVLVVVLVRCHALTSLLHPRISRETIPTYSILLSHRAYEPLVFESNLDRLEVDLCGIIMVSSRSQCRNVIQV